MTSLDPGAISTLTLAVNGDAVTTDTLQHAVRRDLSRLIRVLSEPVTAVRRGALIDHTCFLLDQLQDHHRVLDEVSWPRVLAARPELVDVASRVALAHGELAEPLRSVRNSSLDWRGDARHRLDVLAAVRELAAALSPVLVQDSELAPLIDEVLGAGQPRGRWNWVGVPTRLARRTFWLLDDLNPRQADLLTGRMPRTAMWILRNGFSGAYNRSAYLMWTGGGTGAAI
jgi:hypothetical protein